jgi:Leucine Rich repeat
MSRRILILAILTILYPTAIVRAGDPSPATGRQVADPDFWTVKAIEQIGGKVVRNPRREGQPVIGVDLRDTDVTDQLLRQIASCEQLQSLDLTGCEDVTDVGLSELAVCKHLQSLKLRLCRKVTDNGMRELARCPQLQLLDLQNCSKVTDVGIKALTACQTLEALYLGGCANDVTEAGMKELAKFKHLRSLSLFHCTRIRDADLLHLTACKQLQELELAYCYEVTVTGLHELIAATSLRTLRCASCSGITKARMTDLKKSFPDLTVRP